MTFTGLFLLSMITLGAEETLFPKLQAYAMGVTGDFGKIDSTRKMVLNQIAGEVFNQIQTQGKANLTVICTHNSRRSHIGQLWLSVAAVFYGVNQLNAFSGGTEATRFHSNAIDGLKRAGFKIATGGSGVQGRDNPTYTVNIGKNLPAFIAFSKRFDHRDNPKTGFAAILVCSEADEACPVVPGARARFSLPHNDPKHFDGTPAAQKAYDDTVKNIAIEMMYVVAKVKDQLTRSNSAQ